MKIKYDGRTNKILWIITIFSALFTLAGWLCSFHDVYGTEMIILVGIYGTSGVFLFSVYHLIMGLCYVRRLKRYGYEVPYKKEDYGNNLQNVPCNKESIRMHAKSMESRILFFLYLIIFVISNVWNVYYFMRWYKYIESNATFCFRILLVLDIYWLIGAVIFYRQMNSEKYRDDVEQDSTRKERIPIEKGTASGIFILYVLVIIKIMIFNASDYSFHSREEHDQQYLRDIQGAIYMAMENACEGESYEQMLEGCYISDWTVPKDEFARSVADSLGISDYARLEDRIYCSDGKPVIYVKIKDGEIYVRMENPLRSDHGTRYTYEVK